MDNNNDIVKDYLAGRRKKWNRYLKGIVVAVMTVITTVLVHTNPNLNLADLTQTTIPGDNSDYLYIPNYSAGIGEDGLLEIKTKEDLTQLDSLTLTLNYNPVNALIFENNPIVFDTDTKFQDAAFEMTASPEDGKLIVTIILEDPITINNPQDIDPATPATHETLFKLNTQLNPVLPEGQVVTLTVEDLALLDGINPIAAPNPVPDMPASTITIEGQNELKVLNAEAIDSTHIAVTFSDFLSDIGNTVAYDVDDGAPVALVAPVEPGTNYGYDQKTVVLTTAVDMTAGAEHTISVDPLSSIESNQQGTIDDDFSIVIFYGFGDAGGVLSDFNMDSAEVDGYNNITVTFSDNVEAASVSKDDFSLSIQGGGAVTIDNVSSVTDNEVELSVSTPLLSENTYLLDTVAKDSILRDSDSAELGINEIAFTGDLNGPRLIGATVTDEGSNVYKLQLTFDEDIQLSGVANNPVGRLYQTGTAAGTLINDFNIVDYDQTISGSTLTIEHDTTVTLDPNTDWSDPDVNFTYSVNVPTWLENSLGVPVEDTYKTITFWGVGHNNNVNTVGTVDVTKKDAFVIPGGNLDFDEVVLADVSVLYDDGTADLNDSEAISSINLINGGDDLEVVMAASLNPDRHYIARIVDNTVDDNTLAAKEFVVERNLDLVSATPLSSTTVRVNFSENIDERDVDAADFEIDDAAIVSMNIDPSFTSAVLEAAGPFSAGDIFKATVVGTGDVYAFDGDAMGQTATFFTGYNTLSAMSSVEVSSVTVVDAQTIRLNFSGAVDEASFTPVNLDVFYFFDPLDPSIRTDLTITDVTRISDSVYELSTAVQISGENYFVIFDGVQDSEGLLLGNETPANFFGFTLPEATIGLVTPSVLSNDLETNVVISGQNLDIVQEVRVGNTVMDVTSQTPTSLVFTVPVGFEANLYNINLIDQADNSLVFESALLVTVPEQGLTVHSDQSQSLPLNVPNDGTTPTTLWLLVEDPVGLASVSSVVADLTQIGGPASAEMLPDTGTQPLFSQWYTYETTVPATIATQDDPYLIPVEVRKGVEVFEGTISVRVTNDVVQSVAPVIDNVYVSPISVSPDGETPVKISAQVTDQDGAHTINSVVADLGALGIGFKELVAIGELTEGTELETRFYESEEFTVPDTTPLGTFTINVVASDSTGEQSTSSLQFEVSTEVTGPKIDDDVSYISPRQSVPNDGKTTFSIHAFVSDPDGISDLQTVTATFGTLGIPPVALAKDVEAATEGENAWYSATGLTVPKTAPLGVHNIEIRATDKAGGIDNLLLRIDVTHKDTLGDPPRVVEDRAYTTPRVAINDGETPVTLYVFVRDDDDDIESVIVNLSEIGQVGEETSGTLGGGDDEQPSDGSCPTGSNVLVCMQPSVKEGDNGQWFILPNVTVSQLTAASPHPYQVEVIVTDSGNKTTSGTIPVYVGTGDDITDQQEPPRALAAIPTSETTIEVLFNKELSANSVLASGKGFNITGSQSTSDILGVFGASINPAGNVVTLNTANQEPGKSYILSVSSDIKDLVGRSVLAGAANRLGFEGFEALGRAPVVEYINATDINTVEVEFRDNLKPSSVRMGITDLPGSNMFGVSAYESDNTANRLDILGVTMLAPGNILQIKTERQVPDMKYRMNFEGLESYDGSKTLAPINKGFKGFNLGIAQHFAASNLADLNGDGKVDFADFTIFSSVYGTVYFGLGENLEEAAANAASQTPGPGQPLQENPDATVPTTSVPAGGQIQ